MRSPKRTKIVLQNAKKNLVIIFRLHTVLITECYFLKAKSPLFARSEFRNKKPIQCLLFNLAQPLIGYHREKSGKRLNKTREKIGRWWFINSWIDRQASYLEWFLSWNAAPKYRLYRQTIATQPRIRLTALAIEPKIRT